MSSKKSSITPVSKTKVNQSPNDYFPNVLSFKNKDITQLPPELILKIIKKINNVDDLINFVKSDKRVKEVLDANYMLLISKMKKINDPNDLAKFVKLNKKSLNAT
jgi:hypothetical protein